MPPERRVPVWIEPPFRGGARRPWLAGGRAYVRVVVSIGARDLPVDLLIDTGSTHTMLGTMQALKLLEDDYFGIEFDRDADGGAIRGIGGAIRCVRREAALSFRTEAGPDLQITAPILIPELTDAPLGGLPLHVPGLLGRDLLGGGALTLVWQLPAQVEFSNMPSGVGL